MSAPPNLLDRLFRALVVFLAVGNLGWFALTFPGYSRWSDPGWSSPALPLSLLWLFLGLPSLVCGVVAMRRAAGQGGAGLLLRLAFLALLGVSALVPALGAFARWIAKRPEGAQVPWLFWLVIAVFALSVAAYAMRGPKEAASAKDSLKPAP